MVLREKMVPLAKRVLRVLQDWQDLLVSQDLAGHRVKMAARVTLDLKVNRVFPAIEDTKENRASRENQEFRDHVVCLALPGRKGNVASAE